jgi:MFS family permease
MTGALQVNGRRVFFFGALGGLLFGYDTGVISGAILFIKEDFGLSPFMQGAVVAALLLGAMVGAALAGPLSDRMGRRRLIIAAAVTFTVGALAAAAAPSAEALVAAPVRDRARRRLRGPGGSALPLGGRPDRDPRRDRLP